MTFQPSRRRFLAQAAVTAAGGVAAPTIFQIINGRGLPFAWGAGESDVLEVGSPICVHVALDGGNDYLNTLVPVEDGFYNSSTVGHGSIALTAADTLALTGSTYRLHKSLAWLANRWNTTGDVGFVLGVGNLQQEFSHFRSMKFWETARTDMAGHSGWLGRYADTTRPQNPLASVAISDFRPEAMRATSPVLVVQNCSQFSYTPAGVSGEVFLNSAREMATMTGTGAMADVARMMNTTFAVTERIKGAVDVNVTGDPANPPVYSAVTNQLLQCAQLIRAGVPSQSYTLGFGPFDSHINQKQMQTDRFTELNEGLTNFFAALAGHPRERDVFVLITSEFGRQGTVNHDAGTDHGQAGMAVFIGGGTKRGVFGEAPTLDPGGPTAPNRVFDALKPTVDFRTVHATALTRLAKGDGNVADSVLGAHFEDLNVFDPWGAPPSTTTTAPTTSTTIAPTTTTTAAPKPPVAAMTLSKTSGLVGMTVSANGSGSKDPDGTIVLYTWTWGDGTASTPGVTASHKFTKRGTFTVRLTVKDNSGLTGSTTKTVRVL